MCGDSLSGDYYGTPIRFEFEITSNLTTRFSACQSMFDTFLTLFDTDGESVLAACDDCDATGKHDSCGPCCTNGIFNIQSEITYDLTPGIYYFELCGSDTLQSNASFGIDLDCFTSNPTPSPTAAPTYTEKYACGPNTWCYEVEIDPTGIFIIICHE